MWPLPVMHWTSPYKDSLCPSYLIWHFTVQPPSPALTPDHQAWDLIVSLYRDHYPIPHHPLTCPDLFTMKHVRLARGHLHPTEMLSCSNVKVWGWQHCTSQAWVNPIAILLILFTINGRGASFSIFHKGNYDPCHFPVWVMKYEEVC